MLVTVGMAGNSSSSESSVNVVVNLLPAMSRPIRCRDPDCETGVPVSGLQSDFQEGEAALSREPRIVILQRLHTCAL